MAKIVVQNTEVNVVRVNGEDYICLTDMLKVKDGDFFITDWLRNRNTLEFIGIWEKVYNPNFNYGEFATIRNKSGLNSFKISVKEFVSRTNAICLQAKAGRYGGTYAHKDIAFEFAMWISPEFKVYIVKEFQRLKADEQKLLGWSAKRELSKINYRIHTDAIKMHLIPAEIIREQASKVYADEADVLNVAMFGKTVRQIIGLIIMVFGIIPVYAEIIPQNAIPFIYNHHIYIQGSLKDSIPMSIIFDTGAESIYLDKDFVSTRSLYNEIGQLASAVISGAGNGKEERVSLVVEPLQISYGKWKYKDEYSPIIDLRGILGRYVDGMIGNDAFKGKALVVNYSNGYLHPLDEINGELRDGYVEIPAQFKDNRIFVEGELKIDSAQTLKGYFMLDLGCGASLILTNHSRKRLNLTNKNTALLYASKMGIGGDGTEIMFRADSFRFLDDLNNIVVYASYSDKGALSQDNRYIGIVGNPILCHCDLIIDYANKKLYAKRNTINDMVCHTSSRMQMGYLDRTDICDGWIVNSLYQDGIAQKAGFEIGDIILSINDRPVKEITWEEQRIGLELNGETTYRVRKADGQEVTYTLNIQGGII